MAWVATALLLPALAVAAAGDAGPPDRDHLSLSEADAGPGLALTIEDVETEDDFEESAPPRRRLATHCRPAHELARTDHPVDAGDWRALWSHRAVAQRGPPAP